MLAEGVIEGLSELDGRGFGDVTRTRMLRNRSLSILNAMSWLYNLSASVEPGAAGGVRLRGENAAGGVGTGSATAEGVGARWEPLEAVPAMSGYRWRGLIVEHYQFTPLATCFAGVVVTARLLSGTLTRAATLSITTRHG